MPGSSAFPPVLPPGRGLLVTGTSSDAGKSLIAAALCRVLVRRGVRVAPFKAQNMSNNSMVCRDGAEIGRAQYLQALAARVVPEAAMNPVLLKPGTERRAHVVVLGRPAGVLQAGEYASGRRHLAEAAFGAYADLAGRFDVVVCEGAGSPAEINLRAGDYVNFGLAREFGMPVVLVGDIDRGACWPRATARGRCSMRRIGRCSKASWSTSSGATPASCNRDSTRSRDGPGCPSSGSFRGCRGCGSTGRMPCRSTGGAPSPAVPQLPAPRLALKRQRRDCGWRWFDSRASPTRPMSRRWPPSRG